jgi:hypothetical protein
MSIRRTVIACLFAATGAMALGCVGASSSSSGGGGGGGTPDSACDEYFDAYLASYACTLALPQSEATRLRPLFDELCADEVALPGSALTSARLSACAKAVQADPCSEFSPAACTPTASGTLAVGETCIDSVQCASGACTLASSFGDDGGAPESSCGACTATVPAGGACDPTNPQCAASSECTMDGSGSSTCVAATYGGAGVMCDSDTKLCDDGLVCDSTTEVCAQPGVAGAACETSRACAAGLVCADGACAAGAALGAPCGTTTACGTGLTCDASTGACAAIQWASDGDACSESSPCLVGVCNFEGSSTSGICPDVAANGQPCPTDATSTCDTFSECINGVCAFPNSLSCK